MKKFHAGQLSWLLENRWTSMNLKEAAAFLVFIISGAAMDSDRRAFPGIIFLAAAAVLYGQAKGKEKNEKED